MLLIIDNYDSFTYNIYQMLAASTNAPEILIIRNDLHTLQQIKELKPNKLLISPGPGKPDNAGISLAAIQYFAGRIPVLGVCLGHQSLAQVYGGKVVRAERLMHGKTSPILHDNSGVFNRMPKPFTATRYHSLIVDRDSLDTDFTVTAWTQEQEIMGICHTPTGAEGVQFHPESILTEDGTTLLGNFLAR